MRKITGAAAVTAMLLAMAPANAGCWSADQASAAQIRDLQSHLMVATLKCQVAHIDLTADYNAFISGNRTAIGAINTRLKAHFIRADGPIYGQQAYDRFTTSLANAYGASRTNADTCENARALAQEAAMMANDEQGLMMIATREGFGPNLPGGLCGREEMASASTGSVQGTARK
jgi:hypothetical protein